MAQDFAQTIKDGYPSTRQIGREVVRGLFGLLKKSLR